MEAKQSKKPMPTDGVVAICTGRVEAKDLTFTIKAWVEAVAICTGRVEAKTTPVAPFLFFLVAICTGRVEAKLSIIEI